MSAATDAIEHLMSRMALLDHEPEEDQCWVCIYEEALDNAYDAIVSAEVELEERIWAAWVALGVEPR